MSVQGNHPSIQLHYTGSWKQQDTVCTTATSGCERCTHQVELSTGQTVHARTSGRFPALVARRQSPIQACLVCRHCVWKGARLHHLGRPLDYCFRCELRRLMIATVVLLWALRDSAQVDTHRVSGLSAVVAIEQVGYAVKCGGVLFERSRQLRVPLRIDKINTFGDYYWR